MARKPPKSPKATKAAAPATSGDLDVLRELVALLDASSATSIKLGRADASYEVSRTLMPDPAALAAASRQAAPPAPPVGGAAGVPAPVPSLPAAAHSNLIEIKSPMVGTFYRAPEPGAEQYVKVGNRVAPGQTLCIIEAMKIMNEIESEVSGSVREILVEDAQPVEFGQVLFRVEPNA